jgi:hypothetical protein
MYMEMTTLCRTILTAALIALLAAPSGCATSGSETPASATNAATQPPAAAELPQLLGVAVLQGNNGVLCTSGQEPQPGQKITVVLPDTGKTLTALVLAGDAALQGKRACYMDEAAKAHLTKLAFEGRKGAMPAVGIGFLKTGPGIKLDSERKVDLDADGMLESFKACTSSEGVHLTVWTGDPHKGIRRWHAYYFVDYDTKATCTAGET